MIAEASLSSNLVTAVTLYRNDRGGKVSAQFGYALTFCVSTVESVAAAVISLICLSIVKFSKEPLDRSIVWLKSASFSMAWSLYAFVTNPIHDKLITGEVFAMDHAKGWIS